MKTYKITLLNHNNEEISTLIFNESPTNPKSLVMDIKVPFIVKGLSRLLFEEITSD